MKISWTYFILVTALCAKTVFAGCDSSLLANKHWVMLKRFSSAGLNLDDNSKIYRDGWMEFDITLKPADSPDSTHSYQNTYLNVREMVLESADKVTGTATTNFMRGVLDPRTCILNLQWEQKTENSAQFIEEEPELGSLEAKYHYPAHTSFDRQIKILNVNLVNPDTYELEILLCENETCVTGKPRSFAAIDMNYRRTNP